MEPSTDQGSADNLPSPAEPPSKAASDTIRRWNRKLHYYLGLYLLLFVWLFSFTGLLLNHGQWKFAEFWENRKQTAEEYDIRPPSGAAELEKARNLMRQLGIRGEVDWTATGTDAAKLEFRVSRPGHIYEIKADLEQKRAAVKRIDLNTWGVMRILHTFTGVRMDDARNTRDWVMTSLWAWTMDAVAIGLIAMVLSSYWMWLELPRKRIMGAVALAAGFGLCGLFCFGLRWFSL